MKDSELNWNLEKFLLDSMSTIRSDITILNWSFLLSGPKEISPVICWRKTPKGQKFTPKNVKIELSGKEGVEFFSRKGK